MADINIQPTFDDIEGDAQFILPILHVPPKMLTRNRIAALLALTGEISMRVVIDGNDELSIAIGVPDYIFDAATDSELAEVVHLFHGLEEAAYHPRLLAILKRSLN